MSFARNVLTVSGATLASRILGFARDTMIAAVLGTSVVADAFFVAFRLPNLFRRLFAEGAFASAFVPLLVRTRDEIGADEARRTTAAALIALSAAVGLFTALAMVFAPALVGVLAPGFSAEPEKFALTVRLARICLPYLAAVSIAALFAGILAAERRFFAAAIAPVTLNLVFIAVLIGLLRRPTGGAEIDGVFLAAAVVVAGLVQLALLVAATAAAGSLPAVRAPRFDARVGRFGRLLVPGVIAGGLAEINVVVGTMIASVEPGAVSWLYYADRLYQLPLGVVGIAIGQVLLPEIADGLTGDDDGRPVRMLSRALEAALALALPAAVALFLLARPIVAVLFERGAFGGVDAVETARAIAAFAVGLPAFVLVKVFSPAFFAREDTRTPMLAGGVGVAVNLAVALAAFPFVGWIAVAWATAAAGWVNALVLAGLLLRRRHWRVDPLLVRRLPRLTLAAATMGAVVGLGAAGAGVRLAAETPLLARASALGLLVVLGVGVHAGLLWAFGVVDSTTFRRRRADPPCSEPSDAA
jgi:putative peptidoglycan lipid II flippase